METRYPQLRRDTENLATITSVTKRMLNLQALLPQAGGRGIGKPDYSSTAAKQSILERLQRVERWLYERR
jgi:hypothetical protein